MPAKSDVVHSDPDILSGTPVFVGTRVRSALSTPDGLQPGFVSGGVKRSALRAHRERDRSVTLLSRSVAAR